MATRFLTSADSSLAISVETIFPVPVIIQGYSANDMFGFSSVNNGEIVQGADGLVSAGWVPTLKPMSISIMATSGDTIDFFQSWLAQEDTDQRKYKASGILSVPAVGQSAVLSEGYMIGQPTFYSASPRLANWTFNLTWGSVVRVPLAV